MTGATGYIGTAVASALLNAGHELTAVARPGSDTGPLEMAGVKVVRGVLSDLAKIAGVISAHDTVVHTAADHSRMADADADAIDAILPISKDLESFVYTSGVWVFGNTGDRMVDEESELDPLPIVAWRPSHEARVLEGGHGRAAVVRPGCVYGGRQSLLRDWFAAAERGDPIPIVGDGDNHWALVHQDDLADLYLRIIESRASGIFHGVDDSRPTMNEMAAAVNEASGNRGGTSHTDLEDARKELGPFADALALDQHVSSRETRSALQWEPSIGFIEGIERQWAEWQES
jgi:nucleoside-diphosphate-sugar epimerase